MLLTSALRPFGNERCFLQVILGGIVTRHVEGRMREALGFLYFLLATMLPLLITIAAYALMIVAVSMKRVYSKEFKYVTPILDARTGKYETQT